ncbi:MAG: hypothetical protein NTW10_12335 [Bacteroidetes bacterium]|nr:hypothetical protein [Bacteroidota bacterium]
MRTNLNNRNCIVIILLFSLIFIRQTEAQTLYSIPTYNGAAPPASLVNFYTTNPVFFRFSQPTPTPVSRFGIGAFTLTPTLIPSGIFHLRYTASRIPILKLESPAQGAYRGDSILFLEARGGSTGELYGIYQSGSTTTKNYFEAPIGIGIQNPACMLDVNGAVHSKSFVIDNLLATGSFQMKNGAAEKYVLVSDSSGNGTWKNPSGFVSNFWKPTLDRISIYLNKDYGKVGIGTDKPLQKLHVVNGNILVSRQEGQTKGFGSLNGSVLFGEVATDSLPNGEWGIEYYNPATAFDSAGLNFWKVGSPTYQGSNYNLFLRNDGNVGIGTKNPQSKLAVNGKVTAKEFEATLDGFPDYVLKKDYSLRSLPELEAYIEKNFHLPEIPSENEVKQNGLNLGNMDAALLKKVEELTLYVISLNKKIEKLEAELSKK